MNKVAEFYTAALKNSTAKEKLIQILGETPIDQASDAQLEEIGVVAKEMNFDISVEEAKAYLHPTDSELNDDELDEVAGGKGDTYYVTCGNGVGMVDTF